MATTNITIAKIDALKDGEELWDALIVGFHVRAGKTAASFRLQYRLNGEKHRSVIGRYGSITLDQARKIAREWLGMVAEGKDPMFELAAREAAATAKAQVATVYTLAELKAKYELVVESGKATRKAMGMGAGDGGLKKKPLPFTEIKEGTEALYGYQWAHIMGYFGATTPLTDITKDRIAEFHEHMSEKRVIDGQRTGGPTAANRAVRFLGSLLAAAVGWKMLDRLLAEDATEDKPQWIEKHREQYLTPEHAPKFKAMLDKYMVSTKRGHKQLGYLIRLLLSTPKRRGEFMTARLSWVDWDKATMTIPDSKNGKKTFQLFGETMNVLVERAEEWIASGARPEHDWIIQGRRPHMHLTNPLKGWKRFLKDAGLPYEGPAAMHLHDLRHTFATVGYNMAGADMKQIGRALDHSENSTVTPRYVQAMPEATRAIMDRTNEEIKNMMAGHVQYQNTIVPEHIRLQREALKKLQETTTSIVN